MSAQLALYEGDPGPASPPRQQQERQQEEKQHQGTQGVALCASCRAHEARYGFRRADDDPLLDRPRTLCFECFRLEIGRRRDAARARQARLPLEETLDALSLRRRRAQIAARRALGRP